MAHSAKSIIDAIVEQIDMESMDFDEAVETVRYVLMDGEALGNLGITDDDIDAVEDAYENVESLMMNYRTVYLVIEDTLDLVKCSVIDAILNYGLGTTFTFFVHPFYSEEDANRFINSRINERARELVNEIIGTHKCRSVENVLSSLDKTENLLVSVLQIARDRKMIERAINHYNAIFGL